MKKIRKHFAHILTVIMLCALILPSVVFADDTRTLENGREEISLDGDTLDVDTYESGLLQELTPSDPSAPDKYGYPQQSLDPDLAADEDTDTDNEDDIYIGDIIEDDLGYELPTVSNSGLPRLRKDTSGIPSVYYDNKGVNGVPSNLPPVKDQNPYGTCWAFSTIGSIEADLIHTGIDTSPDLSEYHLAYYGTHTYTDPKGLWTDTIVPDDNEPRTWLMNGGNVVTASRLLSNLVGPLADDDAPYVYDDADVYVPSGSGTPSDCRRQIKNAYFISPLDTDDVKRAIMDHGGVSTSYYQDANYYQKSTNSYNYTGSEIGTNHAVMLVGWNDNFPKEDFKYQPSKNGAWLIRNSWGETSFSQKGYFWLSYEDKGFNCTEKHHQNIVTAFDVRSDLFDHCYAYDGQPKNSATYDVPSQSTIATTFRVTGGETIKGAAFELGSPNVTAAVTVTNKSTGETINKTVHTTYSGIYTADFDKGMYVPADAEVEMSVKYTSDDGNEVTVILEPTNMQKGKSVKYYPKVDKGFTIGSRSYDFDPRMKLYTKDLPEPTTTPAPTTPAPKPITTPVPSPVPVVKTNISTAAVVLSNTSFKYNTKVQRPNILTIGGKALKEGTDYQASWSNASSKKAGTYKVTVNGIGKYTGSTGATYKITKVSNPLTLKGKTVSVKASSLKKKKQTLKISKVMTVKKKGSGAVTYVRSSGNKKIKIDKKTGKVTVPKGLKKGKYTIQVKVTVAADNNYNKTTKKVKFTINVK